MASISHNISSWYQWRGNGPGFYENTFTLDAKASDTLVSEFKVLDVETPDTTDNRERIKMATHEDLQSSLQEVANLLQQVAAQQQ